MYIHTKWKNDQSFVKFVDWEVHIIFISSSHTILNEWTIPTQQSSTSLYIVWDMKAMDFGGYRGNTESSGYIKYNFVFLRVFPRNNKKWRRKMRKLQTRKIKLCITRLRRNVIIYWATAKDKNVALSYFFHFHYISLTIYNLYHELKQQEY